MNSNGDLRLSHFQSIIDSGTFLVSYSKLLWLADSIQNGIARW